METNETILTRKVVGIDDRKMLGNVSELRVDCDTLAVSHYIVGSATTNAPLALPFEKALAVGDTFVTIQSRDDFVPAGTADAQAIVRDGYAMLGCEAFSRLGNALGMVKSYEFDPVFGTVTSLTLNDGTTFPAGTFVFFSPEFVFVDDGAKTAAELRAAGVSSEEAPAGSAAAEEPEAEPVEAEPEPEEPADEEAALESEPEEPAEAEADAKDEDADVVALLLGASLTEDVTSKDGEFTAKKGTALTQAVIDEAREHDALLLLVMSIED